MRGGIFTYVMRSVLTWKDISPLLVIAVAIPDKANLGLRIGNGNRHVFTIFVPKIPQSCHSTVLICVCELQWVALAARGKNVSFDHDKREDDDNYI